MTMNVPITAVIVFLLAICLAPVLAQQKVETEGLLTVRSGALPIILSAPHGGRRPIANVAERRGIGIAQFSTGRDNHTDRLAENIAAELERRFGAKPFVVIAHFERKYLDANRPAERAYESSAAKPFYDAYHHALLEACRRIRESWGRGLLLDIHGQAAHDETIYRGTYNGRTVSALTRWFGREALTGSSSIFGYLEQKGYRISPPAASRANESRYIGGFIVQSYGSHRGTGVDAIQMEFGSSLRSRANVDRVAADVAEAIAHFAGEYLPAAKLRAPLQPVLQP